MMYHIALCDDEAVELDKTEQMLNEYQKRHAGVSFLTERFERADELLHLIREKSYVPDLLLMDIYMPEKMGIEAAKERGVRFGRPENPLPDNFGQISRKWISKEITAKEAAQLCNMPVTSFYRKVGKIKGEPDRRMKGRG